MIDALVVLLVRLFCGPHVTYLHRLDDSRSRIYFANHNSHFDFLVAWASLPVSQRTVTRPVAARDYWAGNPLRYFLAVRLFRAVLIERRHPTQENNPLDDMVEALEQRRSLIIFPEGTRNLTEDLRAFQPGLYHLCRACPDVEAIPVFLANLNRVLPKGEFLPLPILSRVTFGEPVRLESDETRSQFLERARAAVLTLKDV
jgi:1-acyl-sn-glycerol-3-phosphate acyltransferase